MIDLTILASAHESVMRKSHSLSRATLIALSLTLASVLSASILASSAHANTTDADEEYVGFDDIIHDLKRESNTPAPASTRTQQSRISSSENPFDSIWIHGGIGFATTMQSMLLGSREHNQLHLNHKGIQASLGIDLFSDNWMAEATTRSFGETESASALVSLKEFELKIFFKDKAAKQLGYRIGAGLSGRYMSIKSPGIETIEQTTPASVLTLGLDLFLSEKFSLGADLSARNAMITDTSDRSSFDATLRLDTHF